MPASSRSWRSFYFVKPKPGGLSKLSLVQELDAWIGRYKWKRKRWLERLHDRLFWHLVDGRRVKEHGGAGSVWGTDCTYSDGAPIMFYRDPWSMADHLVKRAAGFNWEITLLPSGATKS